MPTITINQGENFYCQTFDGLPVPDEISAGLAIAPNIWAGRGLPVVPGEHWEKWLGELAFRDIRTSLVLTATATQPGKGYIVNDKLREKLKHITVGLILQGVPSYHETFLIAGANETGEPDARHFGRRRVFYPSYGSKPLSVGRFELDRAVFLASRLESIDHKGGDWRRLRRAIDALTGGSTEPTLQDERLHQFVRSLEGLILPQKAKTEAQFIHRSQTFAIANDKTAEALKQLFDIRSKVEHLHSALDAVEGATVKEKEEQVYWRTRQVDHLARFAISCIVENDSLREIFRTDASIADFWSKENHERAKLWTSRLDLNAIT